jgi:hypothetical protein
MALLLLLENTKNNLSYIVLREVKTILKSQYSKNIYLSSHMQSGGHKLANSIVYTPLVIVKVSLFLISM